MYINIGFYYPVPATYRVISQKGSGLKILIVQWKKALEILFEKMWEQKWMKWRLQLSKGDNAWDGKPVGTCK